MMNIRGMVLLGVVVLSIGFTPAPLAASNQKPDLHIDKINVQQNEATVYTEIKDGLEFAVTLDKTRFTLQDEIKVHVQVTNVSDHAIHLFTGVASAGYVSAGISDAQKSFWLASESSDYDLPVPQVEVQGNLQPGASIEYENVVLPKINLGAEQVDAWGGTYFVGAGLTRNPDDTVTVSFPITIESDAEKVILPEAAEKAALESADYKKWFMEHTGKNVVWTENNERYAIMKGELSKIGQELYEEVLAENEKPNKNSYYENGNWVVRISSHYGEFPLSIIIKVDAITGNVVSTEYADY